MNTKNATNILTWKGIAHDTIEHCHINSKTGLTVFTGSVTGMIKEYAISIHYEIEIDMITNDYSVGISSQKDLKHLVQIRRMGGKWYDANNDHEKKFDECEYFDISLTPLTNTFPINRLRLKTGESKIIRVVYIDAVENKLKRVEQRYTHVQEGKYRYDSLETGFTTELTVDAAGFVISYPGIWERVFPAAGSAATD